MNHQRAATEVAPQMIVKPARQKIGVNGAATARQVPEDIKSRAKTKKPFPI